jgi:hypothetical protein
MKARIIDVEISAKPAALEKCGASEAQFAAALEAALTSLAGKSPQELPRPWDIPISVLGKEQRLGDLAAIRVKLGPSQESRDHA